MTRKDFERLAWELRQRYPEPSRTDLAGDLGSDFYSGRVHGWESAVMAVAAACAASNACFDSPRFFAASGLQRRPDGSMYPTKPPR